MQGGHPSASVLPDSGAPGFSYSCRFDGHGEELPDQHGLKKGNGSQRKAVKSLALEIFHGGWIWGEA